MAVRNFDSIIIQNFKTQAADTFPIKMIEIEKIRPNEKNFYSLNDIEILAEDINRQGLKHNLVVYENENEKGNYIIISGHRRFAAVSFLITKGKWKSNYLPCSVSTFKSTAETMLNLIMLNATTRVLSDSELLNQYEVLEKIIKEDKELYNASGRIRDKIASVLKISSSQVGKIENIKRNASEELKEAVKSGNISISTANELAKLEENEQRELIKDVGASKISNKMVKEKQSKTKEDKKNTVKNESRYDENADVDVDIDNDIDDEEKNYNGNDNEEKNYNNEVDGNIFKKENESDNKNNLEISENGKKKKDYSELINLLSNDSKRRMFTDNYKEWGLWFEVKELFQKYYKYDLPDETRIIVMEYKFKNQHATNKEEKYKTFCNTYIQKDLNFFSPNAVSDFDVSDYLKMIKEKISDGYL